MIVSEIESAKINLKDFGGKASNLFQLKNKGFRVPKFVVIPSNELSALLPQEIKVDRDDTVNFIKQLKFPDHLFSGIRNAFDLAKPLAVRSSAAVEDGKAASFAGLFESVLYVPEQDIEEAIKKVWLSLYSDRVQKYLNHHNLEEGKESIAIILQEMIDADISGVAFGLNPTNGNQDEKIINSVYGLGEGLVSGSLTADMYTHSAAGISEIISRKESQFLFNQDSGYGLKSFKVPQERQEDPTLSHQQINEIAILLDELESYFKSPQDIEFAYKDNTLYLLQSRPISASIKSNDSFKIVWDNSNIIESYPGVTTPLTFSFISQSYQQAYQLFSEYLGVSPKVITDNQQVFKNTLGLIWGRVYYNLKSWYMMLAMLPGYSLNARYMETMMGVKERFDVPDKYIVSKRQAYLSIVSTVLKMLQRMIVLPKKRKAFFKLLDETISTYNSIDLKAKSAPDLLNLYNEFEEKLLNEWKAPLLNDFFAMIWFGLLQKYAQKYIQSDNPNIHNDLLCGSSDIISTQPIHRTMAIATSISRNEKITDLFKKSSNEVWRVLNQPLTEPSLVDLKKEIQQYLRDFGERCVGELKLETLSYAQAPEQFIRVLQSYVNNKITLDSTSNNLEKELRTNAEKEVQSKLKLKFIKKYWFKLILKKTRNLVSGRENLRYERTRAFGVVRRLFSAIGERFYEQDLIADPRDIFYLSKQEIEAYIQGRAVFSDLKSNLSIRKSEYETYKNEAPPPERFFTHAVVYANDFRGDQSNKEQAQLSGIGCCPGHVKAKVRVIDDPAQVDSLKGDILVTSSTDPGWVTLFPTASGILVERGSLLSHSAIVSREMGIPCIVGVTGLLKQLKTGDEVIMDGSSGKIQIVKS